MKNPFKIERKITTMYEMMTNPDNPKIVEIEERWFWEPIIDWFIYKFTRGVCECGKYVWFFQRKELILKNEFEDGMKIFEYHHKKCIKKGDKI